MLEIRKWKIILILPIRRLTYLLFENEGGGWENDIKNPNPMIQPCHRPSIFYDTLTTTTI